MLHTQTLQRPHIQAHHHPQSPVQGVWTPHVRPSLRHEQITSWQTETREEAETTGETKEDQNPRTIGKYPFRRALTSHFDARNLQLFGVFGMLTLFGFCVILQRKTNIKIRPEAGIFAIKLVFSKNKVDQPIDKYFGWSDFKKKFYLFDDMILNKRCR